MDIDKQALQDTADKTLGRHLRAVTESAVLRRAFKLDYKTVYRLLDNSPFILAGGALCADKVSDYDLYPVEGHPFDWGKIEVKLEEVGGKTLFKSANALTAELPNGQIVQFCTYHKPTLKELVLSFDFTHIQAGITFTGYWADPCCDNVYVTDKFIAASVSGRTQYDGSEYPFSSLIRAGKYQARGRLTRTEAARTSARILNDILKRGFKDYADFKDQMDAIDLGMDCTTEASDLWITVRDSGLVKDDGHQAGTF